MTASVHLYTCAVVNHGRLGWRWTVMDWGIVIETGHEPNKSAALEKARAVMREKKQRGPGQCYEEYLWAVRP